MQRYLVTGANGFIGRALCHRMQAEGRRVRALLRQPCAGPWDEVIQCDLAAEPLPPELMDGVDGVFHLAGIAHVQDIAGVPDALYQRVNVDATTALLEAAAASGVRAFVYFSSIKAVADPGEHCVDEDWDAWPEDAYGRSKREAEQRVLDAGRATGLHVCNLRPCLVYGPGVKGNLARMIDAIDRGRFPPLPEFHNRRSLVGLDDVVDAAWRAMHTPDAGGRSLILAEPEPWSTHQMDAAIRDALGKRAPRWPIPRTALLIGATLGDLVGAATGRRMPLNSAVLSRLRGWACFRSDAARRALDWQPQQRFGTTLPAIIAARQSTAGASGASGRKGVPAAGRKERFTAKSPKNRQA